MNHTMVNDIINEEYPKMEGVDGWLLYKSTGGPGKRKLVAIPSDVDGYTGRFIRSVSSAGKTLLYIAPLQNDLDLTPLPSDAAEFKKMPRAACQVCKKTMPLHILALHIEGCTETQSTSDEEGEFQVMSVTNSSPVNLYKSSSHLIDLTQDIKECPICLCCFPASEIAQHASLCGERLEDGGCLHWRTDSGPRIDPENKMIDEEEDERSLADLSSESDVLQWLASQVDKSKDFKICITRDDLVQRGFIQWQRQKKGSPLNKLNVTFIGEAGIDTGTLSKEFLTEMMHGIERRLFEGSGKKGKSPIYSISDLENGYYRTAGEVFSVSLAQGAPPSRFLRNCCYQFLASGDFDSLKVNKDDVDDLEYALLIKRVEAASDVTELTEEIVNCGYTGLLTSDRKDSIIRAIVLHATMRLTPVLQQIRNGMKPDADYIMAILIPELSERGSQRHARENAVINFLQDFLQDLEIPDQEEAEEVCGPMPQELQAEDQGGHWSQNQPSRMSVPTVVQWLTGQRHKPLLPSERADFKINVRFDHLCKEKNPGHHICYPLVSACTNTVTFPVAHMNTYTERCDNNSNQNGWSFRSNLKPLVVHLFSCCTCYRQPVIR
ncbi:uncharacterized protein LOC115777020 isoform X2 [Archocentrus centrarchus]|uniref:uncharacterized protein LOC115777020 isoform X2 n=1 Tax=Archocentrus centrarchus TaxID=63155 RepID=UPI0011EA01CC|nr:uncharacterized protein LOC115777020 isoform X2 [Archocentrus centrarchus]